MRGGLAFLTALVLSLAAGLGGYALYELWTGDDDPQAQARASLHSTGQALVGEPRPDFSLPDLSGAERRIAEWDGQVVLLNFWATWCPPCRREIPAFVDMQHELGEQGLAVVGVAVDDPDKVRDFVARFGVDYVNLTGGQEASQVSLAYGNRASALPYSVIIARDGRIAHTHAGELPREQALELIRPLL
jgi:peroxiredoxin